MQINLTLVAFLSLTGSACIVDAPSGEKHSESQQHPTVSKAPALSVTNGADLGGKVEVVRASVQPGQIVPGDQVKVTIFFKVLDRLEKEYTIFVHVEDADGRLERMNFDHRPIGGTYPTTLWKKGESIKDEFQLYLPPGARSRALNVWFGLWDPISDTRLPVRNPDAVRHDGNNRVLLARIPVAE